MHSTLCSRVLLNLRKAAAESSGFSRDELNKRSQLAFEKPFSDIEEDSLYHAIGFRAMNGVSDFEEVRI